MGIVIGTRMSGRRRGRGALGGMLVAALLLPVVPAIAEASIGPQARIKSICLRERAILRPEKQAEAVEIATDGAQKRMRMVRVTYCDLQRPGCFAGDAEVSMTICKGPEESGG